VALLVPGVMAALASQVSGSPLPATAAMQELAALAELAVPQTPELRVTAVQVLRVAWPELAAPAQLV
jgi:hypothetical protein